MYLKKTDDNFTYPYTIADLKSDNPNISFPKTGITADVLANFNVYPVKQVVLDFDYTLEYNETDPILSGSEWYQNWEITSASADLIQMRLTQRWEDVREIRNGLLTQSDWTQFQDSPVTGSKLIEWQNYRQSLRDITLQENPFNLTWPDRPE